MLGGSPDTLGEGAILGFSGSLKNHCNRELLTTEDDVECLSMDRNECCESRLMLTLFNPLVAISAQDTCSKSEFKLTAGCSNYYHV